MLKNALFIRFSGNRNKQNFGWHECSPLRYRNIHWSFLHNSSQRATVFSQKSFD